MTELGSGGLLALTLSLDQTTAQQSSAPRARPSLRPQPLSSKDAERQHVTELRTQEVFRQPNPGTQYRVLLIPLGQDPKSSKNNKMGTVWEDNNTRRALCKLRQNSGKMLVDRWTAVILAGRLGVEDIPPVPSRLIKVYVCSTGADSSVERSAFVHSVYPKLREYTRGRYGLQFQVVDLAWGVTNDRLRGDRDLLATKVRQIISCQSQSQGPSFVAFIGQKYGQEPLPTVISANEYEVIRAALDVHKGRDTRSAPLLDQWYVKDNNSMPSVYVLKPINAQAETGGAQNGEWAAQHDQLRHLLKRGAELAYLGGCLDSDTNYKYQTSELEQELQLGTQCDHPHKRCVLIVRDVVDVKNYLDLPCAATFVDLQASPGGQRMQVDGQAEALLLRLRNRARGLVPERNTLTHQVLWRFEDVISPTLHKDYTEKLCGQFHDVLKRLIDEAAAEHQTQAQLQPMAEEALRHWTYCKMASSDFCCHREQLQTMRNYIIGYSDRPLVVHGPTGSGKTTLVSNVALEVTDLLGGDCLCLVRYVGLTAQSSDIRQLMQSLCTQITLALGCLPGDTPGDFKDLQRFFPELLAAIPVDTTVVVILDQIEKIQPDYNAHQMAWLPGHLPSHVKIILITDPEAHGIYHCLRHKLLTSSSWFLELLPLSQHLAELLLRHFLLFSGRKITENQMQKVSRYLKKDAGPLYVKLIAEEVKAVTSGTSASTLHLPHTLSGAVERLLERLEVRFGRILVARSMAYLVTSGTGLSDCEMEDLLSLDDDVLNEVYSDYHPLVRRVPYLAWQQVRQELESFLLPREVDGVTVWALEHDSFAEAIQARYLRALSDVQQVHSLMADYFLGTWADRPKPAQLPESACPRVRELLNKGGIQVDRRVPNQPLTFGDSEIGQEVRFNKRKCEQLPRHLHLSGRLEELDSVVLFSYAWLYHKIKALSLRNALADFALNPTEEAGLVQEALQVAAPTIEKNIDNLAAELSGRLLPYYTTHTNIRNLVQQCDTVGLKQCCLVPNFPYLQVPGSALQYTLECPAPGGSFCFAFEDRYLLSKRADDSNVHVFDLLTGQLKDTIFTSNGELHVTPNGQHFVIVDHVTEKSFKLHESGSGNFLGQVIVLNYLKVKADGEFHAGPLCLTNDRLCAIVTTDTSFLCIAQVPSGEVLEIVVLDGRATVCGITPGGDYIFCNSNDFLLSYDLRTLQHVTTVSVGYKPRCLAFTSDGLRAFVAGGAESKLLVLHLSEGSAEMCYKAVLQDAPRPDPIRALAVASDDVHVAARSDYHVLVYSRLQESLVADFIKPDEVPPEFRLPKSHYTELVFTNAGFTRDSKRVIATIFRKIYIWDIESRHLMAAIQAPIGIITTLLVSTQRDQLVTHMAKAKEVHVWSVDAALRQVHVLDKLTDAVKEVQVTRNCSVAFVRCRKSDEVGVIDMCSGIMLDLLTHETQVVDFAITPNGQRALVTTVPRLSGTCTKLWDVPARKVIHEFGDASGCCVPTHGTNSIVYFSQPQASFEGPHDLSIYHFVGDTFSVHASPAVCRYLRSKPQLTYNDRFLVVPSALAFHPRAGRFQSPCLVVFDLAAGLQRSCFDATSVGLDREMDDVVEVQTCPHLSDSVAVLISLTTGSEVSQASFTTNGSDTPSPAPSQDYLPPRPQKNSLQHFGLFILDLSKETITTLCLQLPPQPSDVPFPPGLIFSSDFRLCLDSSCLLFDLSGDVKFRGQLPSPGAPKTFALGGEVVVYFNDSTLFVARVSDGSLVAKCEAHAPICLLQLCPDQKTLVVGCTDGALASYVVIDPQEYAASGAAALKGVASRCLNSPDQRQYFEEEEEEDGRRSRCWDKVEVASCPAYSRPPSALRPASRDKEVLRNIKPVPRLRPRSDTLLYLSGNKSQVCNVM